MHLFQITETKAIAAILIFALMYACFTVFCLIPRIKNQWFENKNKQKTACIIFYVISFLLIVCGIYLFVSTFLFKKLVFSDLNPFIPYMVCLISLLSMGIRSLLFHEKEVNEETIQNKAQIPVLKKKYQIWGVVTICSAVVLVFSML